MLSGHTTHIIVVGKHVGGSIEQGVADWEGSLKKFCKVQIHQVPAGRGSGSPESLISEAESIRKVIQKIPRPWVVGLQEGEKAPNSRQLGKRLGEWLQQSQHLVFIIGGAFGLHLRLKEDCDTLLSLSPLTLNHQLVRLVLLEQLFRCYSLHFGLDYHHD